MAMDSELKIIARVERALARVDLARRRAVLRYLIEKHEDEQAEQLLGVVPGSNDSPLRRLLP